MRRFSPLPALPWNIRSAAIAGLALAALWGLADRVDAAPARVDASVSKGVLTVTGTDKADIITLRLLAGNANRLTVDVGGDGTADFQFDRQRFTAIVVKGKPGADMIAIDQSNGAFTDTEATTLKGGKGADTLSGGSFTETLLGGGGDDFLDGQQGLDSINGGDGADVVQWDPGDNNDTINSGEGLDRLVFNGSNIAELIDLSATGDHVRLTRNIANITLDINDTETIDINALAGADVITVNNLTGTDTTLVTTNLIGPANSDDTQPDEVIVPAGVVISGDATGGVVTGLGAQVHVTGGGVGDAIHVSGPGLTDTVTIAGTNGNDTVNATAAGPDAIIDGVTPGVFVRLTGIEATLVELTAGDDHFTSAGNIAPLTTLTVNGGDNNDTLLGSNGNDTLNGDGGDDFLDGQQGLDSINGGDGADVVQWDPGDNNDTINSGEGLDRLVFNGSNIAELIDLSATGDHVRLTRNIANITLDINDTETIDINTLAGANVITVNNLTGTDTTLVTTNLIGPANSDDTQPDEVIVPAGVVISGDATGGVVTGLGAQVHVTGGGVSDTIHVSGPGLTDTVTIAGTNGNDTVNATAAGPDTIIDGVTPGVFVRSTGIEATLVELTAGDDHFTSAGNIAPLTTLTVNGGDNTTPCSGATATTPSTVTAVTISWMVNKGWTASTVVTGPMSCSGTRVTTTTRSTAVRASTGSCSTAATSPN